MITLASDFPSPYPAAMRGVICSRSDARIEDIAHDFPRQDVRAAAFWLREVLPYFPPATHCVVVDPGVGTDRAAVVVEGRETVRVGGESVPVRDAYAARDPGDRLVTVGSHGNVEFAVNQGRGDDAFDLGVGDDVLVEW